MKKVSLSQDQLISKACVLLSYSAVSDYDSQTNKILDMTKERISFTRNMLLSLQNGFSFGCSALCNP